MNTEPKKASLIAVIVLNFAMLCAEVYSFRLLSETMGWGEMFVYYTELSNLLGAVSSAILCASAAFCLGRGGRLPRAAVLLKGMAASCLTVTLVVVITVLIPSAGGKPEDYDYYLWSGAMLFHHFICPILAVLSFVLLEARHTARKNAWWILTLPTLAYAAVSITLNVLRVWEGPYPFLLVYEQSIGESFMWAGIIIGGAVLLNVILGLFAGKNRKNV